MATKKLFMRKITPVQMSAQGLAKIKIEYDAYIAKRPHAVDELRRAREMGDLSENAAYHAARFELTSIDRNIRRLTYILKAAVIITATHNGTVQFGSKVSFTLDNKKMEVVLASSYEVDPKGGQLSVNSPIGKALLGKKVGDTFTFQTPVGTKSITIQRVD